MAGTKRQSVHTLYNLFIDLYNACPGVVRTQVLQSKMRELKLVSTFEALRVFRENGLLEQVSKGKYRILYPTLLNIGEGFKALSATSRKRQLKHKKRVASGRVKHFAKKHKVEETVVIEEEPQYIPSIEECIAILTKEGYIVHKLSEGETLTFTKTLKG